MEENNQAQQDRAKVMAYVNPRVPMYRGVFLSISSQQQKILQYICTLKSPENLQSICQNCFVDPRSGGSAVRILERKGILQSRKVGRDVYYSLSEQHAWLEMYMMLNSHQRPSSLEVAYFVDLIP